MTLFPMSTDPVWTLLMNTAQCAGCAVIVRLLNAYGPPPFTNSASAWFHASLAEKVLLRSVTALARFIAPPA